MKLSDAEVRELFQHKTALQGATSAHCLGEEVLIRAANGELAASDRERAANHIAACSDCAREFRIVRSLSSLESAARREFPEPLRAPAWLALAAGALLTIALPALVWMVLERQRAAETIGRLRGEMTELRNRPTDGARTAPEAQEVESLRTTIAELSRPQIDVTIVDLDADVTRGPGDPSPVVTVPAGADGVTLILHLPEPTSAPVNIEFLDSSGSVLASEQAPAKKARSTVTLVLRRKTMSEGEHTVRLHSQAKKSTFRFRVDYS